MSEAEVSELRQQLLGSLLLFIRTFYFILNGREFTVPQPISRESHYITICRALTSVQRGDILRLIANCPPRYGKTEMCIFFVAWCMARYPDSNFLYVSYSHTLAKKQTQMIRRIMMTPLYRELFHVELSADTAAKDNFETTVGGSVYAAGAAGTITGRGAGLQNVNRFGGAIVIDDIHKPKEVTSDTIRMAVNDWHLNTLQSRVNDPKTPIIFIGQRLHEDDLPSNLERGFDGRQWNLIKLCSLDEHNNALAPHLHDSATLLKMAKEMPYVFAAQYQQNPQPAGGGLFKREWWITLEQEPDIYATFITADTAETDKTYNDATVFSFWGLYNIKYEGIDTGEIGLFWLDCRECWIEPKDLRSEFVQFYTECMRHRIKPKMAAIEKKSTGTTLISVLKDMQGLAIIDIERNASSGSKTERFIEVQPYISSKRVALPSYGKHTKMCIDHCVKITANNSHRHDDIADTLADAVKIGLIDKSINYGSRDDEKLNLMLANMAAQMQRKRSIGNNLWQR